MTQKVVLTGGSGYVGTRLTQVLVDAGFKVSILVKNKCLAQSGESVECKTIGDMCDVLDWKIHLNDADYVIHLAARAHIIKESSNAPLDDFMKVNCDATVRLASCAATVGIRRFIYISTIGVLGNSNTSKNTFDNYSKYDPQDMYSISKMKAEIALKKISTSTKMEVVIVRPPLVYGADAPGNFHRLMRLIDLGLPLPLGKLTSRKSMISLYNLCDLITKTIEAPLDRFNILVATDGSNWTTAELVALIGKYMGNKRPIFSVPVPMLVIFASIIGKRSEIFKLMSSLQIDGSKTKEILNWSPPFLPEDGIEQAVKAYLLHKRQ